MFLLIKKLLSSEVKFITRWPGCKHFFIPHSGNDYKPHALHPKRLAFHALSVIGIKLAVVACVAILPMSAWMTPDTLAQMGRDIISQTNGLRQSLNLSVLVDNPLLRQGAADKVDDMLTRQYFAHVSPEGKSLSTWLSNVGYKYVMAGENLALGYPDAAGVMTGWQNSPTHYANLIDDSYKEIGVAAGTGLYKGDDTILIAQFFGLPQANVAVAVKKPVATVAPIKPATVKPAADEDKITVEENKTASIVAVKGTEISNDGVIAVTPTNLEKYSLAKAHQNGVVKTIFNFSSIYFKILLGVLFVALILNIFVEIKKQHPHLILSGLGLAALLLIVIIV
ncbi:MAG: CAP domain-containing protein [Parcubacteria group bacterium]